MLNEWALVLDKKLVYYTTTCNEMHAILYAIVNASIPIRKQGPAA